MADTKVYIFENSFSLTNYFIKKWCAIGHASIVRQGRFSVALCGGQTPVEFYCKLSNLDEPALWSKTHIFLTDERFVSLDHPDSNYKMVRELLLDYTGIPESNIHPVHTYCDSPVVAAQQYEKELRRFFQLKDGELPRFDLLLLGVGKDGHTASLFPGTMAELEEDRLAVEVKHHLIHYERVTLTLPVLNNARKIFIMGKGPSKAKIFDHILNGPSRFPAARVSPTDGDIVFLLDKDAATNVKLGPAYYHDDEAVVVQL